MAMNDLFQALNMFQNGMSALATGRAVRSAAEQAQSINMNEQDEFKKRQQLTQLGTGLAAQLSSYGANPSQIQSSVGAIVPQQLNNPADFFAASQMATSPGAKQQLARAGQGVQSQLAAAPLTTFQNEQIRLQKYQLLNEAAAQKAAGQGKSLDEMLLLPDKKTIETLAGKQGGKIAIASTLQTLVDSWKDLSPDARLQQGREILKTLNSPEGSDAIGVEESRRLGSKLEFVLSGNLFNDNPTQLGRDMEGFYTDLKNSTKKIQKSIERSDMVISKIYKKYGVDIPVMKQTPDDDSAQDDSAIQSLQKKMNQMTPEQLDRLQKVQEARRSKL